MNDFRSNTLAGFPGGASPEWQSISLAALVHVLLLVFLWVGVQWQNNEVTAVEAEVWDMTTREAAPVAAPEPEPEPVREPEPDEPLKAAPKEEPLEDPEIALAQEKKRKEERKQALLKEKEREKEKEKEKLAEQKKKKDQAEKLAVKEAEKKKQLDLKKQNSKEQSARDKEFAENMRRLAGQATGTGGTGDAARSTGNNRGDPSYAARIAAKVRSNTVFNVTDTSSNNPTAEYRIDLLPDGSLRGPIRKLKSSGVPAFDEAVEKAIEKSTPFPRDKSGEVPPSIVYVHRMKE